jgi:AcrR family transcriptional regulator
MPNQQNTEPRRFKAGDELRGRLLEAASRLFGAQGYEQVSIRNIAQEAGCSQMAMYRHFPDKQALLRHLCHELYRQFTLELHERFDNLPDPRSRLRMALRHFVLRSAEYPHHYRLTFLESAADDQARQMRDACSAPAIQYFRQNLGQCLPEGSPAALRDERLHQILAVLHGITVMLIMNPQSYGLTLEAALQRLDAAFFILIGAPDAGGEGNRSVRNWPAEPENCHLPERPANG